MKLFSKPVVFFTLLGLILLHSTASVDGANFFGRLLSRIQDSIFKTKPKVEVIRKVYVGISPRNNEFFYDFSPHASRVYSAVAFLRDDTNVTGWSYLEVSNNVSKFIPKSVMPKVNDSIRAYTAGVAEGILTKSHIDMHYRNTLTGYCQQDLAYCKRLKKFIAENIIWITKMVKAQRQVSGFWHQTGLYLEQLSGIADGSKNKFYGPRTNLYKFEDLYLMNIAGDLAALETALQLPAHLIRQRGGCSAFVKITNSGDLITAHNSWTSYQDMLRIIKHYDLQLSHVHDKEHPEFDESCPNIAAIKMSSYPGYITSLDDYYVTSRRMLITETTIVNYNSTLLKHIQPFWTVPTSIRGVVASRLATNGREWMKVAQRFNSGTYNNEWIVVDYKVWERKGRYAKEGVLTIGNQMPGYFFTYDDTKKLLIRTYFSSYNVPSVREIFEISNTTAMVRTYGSLYSHDKCPRALIFARNQSFVQDLPSALALMRYNNFEQDPLSKCKCNPPYSGELSISGRSDLNLENGSYPIEMLSRRSHGAIDAKLTTIDLVNDLSFISQAGPTFSQVPAFQWSTSGFSMKDTPHYGQPDLFRFDPVIYE